MSQPPEHGGVPGALQPLLELLVVFLFATTFLFQTTRIPSASMSPTLRVGDTLLIDKQSFTAVNAANPLSRLLPPTGFHRGDLAVFYYPADPTIYLVKRIIGLPGDRISLRNGIVFLNGLPSLEPYASHDPAGFNVFRDDFPSFRETDPNLDPLWWATLRRIVRQGELTVPPGVVFVLGDNRDNSKDSRYWGFVPMRNMVGRPLVVFLPALTAPRPPAAGRWTRAVHAIRIVR